MAKIVYLSDSLIPSKRANSVHVMQMCNAMAELGHTVILWGLRGRGKSVHSYYGTKGFTIKRIITPFQGSLFLHGLLSAVLAGKLSPEFILGRSQIGLYWAARFGYQVVFETHSPISAYSGYKRIFVEKLLRSRNIKGIVVISDVLRDLLGKELAVRNLQIPIHVAHDGASITSSVQSGEYNFGFSMEKIQVGYVGTVSKGRGIELIVSCAVSLPSIDFHLIGAQSEDIIKLGIDLKEIPSNLIFHGFLSPVKARIAREKMDILIAPYQNEVLIRSGKNTASYMSPLKIFEYMASQKAIVASDLPVLREVLTHEENALLVDPEDLHSWIQAIRDLSEDSEKRLKLGTSAMEKLLSHYTWEKRAQTIISKFKPLQ